MIKVYNFCNTHFNEGGEMYNDVYEVSEEKSFDDLWCLFKMFENCDNWLRGDCKDGWEEIFDYNVDLIDDDEELMDGYVKEFKEKKEVFLRDRKNDERMLVSGVECDINMLFVEDDKLEEVWKILMKIKLRDVGGDDEDEDEDENYDY